MNAGRLTNVSVLGFNPSRKKARPTGVGLMWGRSATFGGLPTAVKTSSPAFGSCFPFSISDGHSISDSLDYHWLLAGRVYTQNEWSKPRGFPAGVGRVFNPRALIAASSMVGGSNYRETPLRRVGLLPMPPKRAPSGRHPLAHGERPLELETTRCQKHQPPLAI